MWAPITHYRSRWPLRIIGRMSDPSPDEFSEPLPEDVAALGIWLERLRTDAKISRSGLAKALGVDRTSLRRWLDGSHEPGALTLLRILSSLNVAVVPAPHGHFAKSPAEEIRDLRRELFGYPAEAPPRLDLLERIAAGELKAVAAELGVTQREATEIANTGGHRSLEGRLGELAAKVAELVAVQAAIAEELGVPVGADAQPEDGAKPVQAHPKRKKAAGS
jgi:transcriptional regulator with XRE-family HTH domain